MILSRLPFRTLVPLLIVGVLLLGQTVQFFVGVRQARAELTANLETRLSTVGTMTASRIEAALRAGQSSNAKRALEQVLVDPHARMALVFDATDTVLLADSYPLLGKPLTETPFVEVARQFHEARTSGERVSAVLANHGRIYAIYPITLPPAQGEVVGARTGVLALMADMREIDALAMQRAWAGFVSTMATGVAVTVLLWLLLNRYLLGRVRQLQSATDAIADGSYDTGMQLSGRDELAVIGANLEQMRKRLLEQSEKLRKSEERYRSFVQTSGEGIFLLECDPPVPVSWGAERQVSAIFEQATLRTCNRIFAELHDEDSPDALLGATVLRTFGSGGAETTRTLLLDWVRSGHKMSGIVNRSIDGKGHQRVISCSLVGIVRDGMLTGIWGSDRDETVRTQLEQRNRAILSGSRDGFLLLDLDGNVLEVNDAYCRMVGYDAATLTSMRYQDLLAAPPGPDAIDLDILQDSGSASFETHHLAADGRKIELEVSANYLDHRGGRIFTFVRDIGERNAAQRQLESYAAKLQEMSQRLLKLQESERRHIARELHDEIGQQLTALSINLQIAATSAPERDSTLLTECRQIAETLMTQTRDIALNLRPSMLDDLGLKSAVRWLARRQADRGGLDLVLELDAGMGRYAGDLETTAYRVAQEAMTNVLKHSGANTMTVFLRELDGGIHVEISDDGAGFDVIGNATSGSDSNLGLDGLRERVALCGGRLEIESGPGAGTVIRAWLPLDLKVIQQPQQSTTTG